MYNLSADEIHQKMLDNIDDSYQKTIGYPTYDLTRAFAIAVAELAKQLTITADKLNIDNLEDEELNRFTKQRAGISRKQATFATGLLLVAGNGQVKKGDLFESDGKIQYEALKDTAINGQQEIVIKAVIAGPSGNVGAGAVTMMPKTIQGITSCINNKPITGGYTAETDQSLRERYYIKKQQPPTSGNIYHYISWAREVEGVGGAKVFPLWAGDNTVQIVVINDLMQPPDAALVTRVQDYIDPNSEGLGAGQAPIGAYCTVAAAIESAININVMVETLAGHGREIENNIKDNITAYLRSIAFKQSYVSYGKIAAAINDTEGVRDYSNLVINGGVGNIVIEDKAVAVLGEVIIDVY